MTFAADVDKFMVEVAIAHIDNTARVEEALYAEIVSGSPVGVYADGSGRRGGAYKSSHRRSLGEIDETVTTTGGVTLSPSPKKPKEVKDLLYYISNSLPYARPLEDGHSAQAPEAPIAIYGLAYNSVKSRFGL